MNELLSVPVTDVTACPVVQSDEDVRRVVSELELILRKCLYCIRARLATQLDIFLSVMAQATTARSEQVVRGMSQRAEEGTCLDLFCELTAQILARVNAALRLDIDSEQLFEVLQVVCADAKLKDKVGGVLGKLLLDYMHDTAQHSDDYRVHRGCASALITLLRGSSANKNRFSAECEKIAACLQRSSDFFFQMQCVEILFRLHTHNRTVLAQAKMDDFLRRGITNLPNDATLLLSIQNFLDSYNAEFNTDRVVPFTIVRMEIDGVEVCSHTTMYFSPLLLVVLLPGGTGDNFTIPFEEIRSVKLSKDHKLGLRLHVIPPKLSLLMDIEEGRDTLHVFLTQSTLVRLRSSCVHTWIADRKRNAPRRPAPTPVPVRSMPASRQLSVGAAEEELVANNTRSGQASLRGSQANSRAASTHAAATARGTGFPITERQPNRRSPSKVLRTTDGEAEGAKHASGDSRLEEVHRAATRKAARYREQQVEQLQHAADRIGAELEETRRLNARDRDHFEASFREDMTSIRRSEAALKDGAAECVQSLNAELEDVQALGALLKAEADKLRTRLTKAVGKSEGVEEASLIRIKRLVDAQMQRMEADLATILTETNPLAGVSQHLSERMAELSTGAADTRPKSRRLEYS